MSDKPHKKEVRRQRREEDKARRTRELRRQNILVWGGVSVIVLLAGFLVFQSINPAGQPGTAVRDLGNQHVNTPEDVLPGMYNSTPPTSGPHMPRLWSWGISQEQIPDAWQVHNLEDGGVLMQYDCPDGCSGLLAQVTELASRIMSDTSLANSRTGETHFILAPYTGIRDASGGKPIALTAWTRIQYFDAVDVEEMMKFIRAYINVDHHRGGTG